MPVRPSITAFPTPDSTPDDLRYNGFQVLGTPSEPTRTEIHNFLSTLSQIVYRQAQRKTESDHA